MFRRNVLPAPSFLLSLFALVLCCGISPARADTVPSDPTAFTEYVSRAIAKAIPGAKIAMTAPLYLAVEAPTGGKSSAYLQSLYSQCQRVPEHCDGIIATWVDQMSTSFSQKEVLPDRTTLRIVLRPTTYVEQLRQSQKEEPIAAPFLAGLWMICVYDLPTTIGFPKASQIEALGLTREEALALCRQNTAAALPPIMSVAKPAPAGSIGYITGDAYASSRILLPETWQPLAEQGRGQLIVTVPGSDLALYTQATDRTSIGALGALTSDVIHKVTRPISVAIFRWTPTGFVEVRP